MQQIINRKEADAMITMEEYLRKKNVIKGKEPEAEERGRDLHSRGKKENKGEDTGKAAAARWSAVMTLAELLFI